MPAGKPYCRVCKENHDRPVGRNCRRAQVGDAVATSVSVSGPAQATPLLSSGNDIGSEILRKLTSIDSKVESLERRVTETETNLASRTTDLPAPQNSNRRQTLFLALNFCELIRQFRHR